MPTKNPWSLPFGHKQIFADRLRQYDLFIYSEDDILITERNVEAFLWATSVLSRDEIAGFLLMELGPDGSKNYPQAHGPFHWDVKSVKSADGHIFASFTNEHSACYLITQDQLQRAIDSGGFLVGPHEGRYDMLCSAATDPYTQCGFTKLTCISRFSDFELHHLPNNYVTKFGTSGSRLEKPIDVLATLNGDRGPSSLFPSETKILGSRFSKDYYEPVRKDVVAAISATSQSVLSLGSGAGETGACLVSQGKRVVAVPMDSVISAGLESRGVEVMKGDLSTVRNALAGQHFDCVLLLGGLHLVQDPVEVLRSFVPMLHTGSQLILTVPNLSKVSVAIGRLRRDKRYVGLGDYDRTGVHVTSAKSVRRWISSAGLRVEKFIQVVPQGSRVAPRTGLEVLDSLFASEFIVAARRS